MNGGDDRKWHLDKKVPLALITAIAVQSFAAVWWASGIDSRVNAVERRQDAAAPHIERIIRLETRMEAIAEHLIEIRNILRQRERP